MANQENKYGLIPKILKQAEAYSTFDLIESYVDQGGDLTQIPVQPLYMAIKDFPAERKAELLPRLSKQQRTAILDLELWTKDDLDVATFENWVLVYDECKEDSIKKEFLSSSEFLLYLKGAFNVWTFDVEDPEYPDHDNYFLTDDNQLLFEFHEEYPYADNVRSLVRHLYYELGVEEAYTFLFKLTVDSFMIFQEEEYQKKKYRLQEIGFVDYFDALAFETPYPNMAVLDNTILKKEVVTATLDKKAKDQSLHSQALVAYKSDLNSINSELDKLDNEKREEFLQFNFMRLVNGTIEAKQVMKQGPMAMAKVGQRVKSYMNLGLEYVKSLRGEEDNSIFEKFDFLDLYRIGLTLTALHIKNIKSSLRKFGFGDDDKGFLGNYFDNFLTNSMIYDVPVYEINEGEKPLEVNNLKTLSLWKRDAQTLEDMIPFIAGFKKVLDDLKVEGRLQDSFYHNYHVDDLDFEALILSNFANHSLALYSEENSQKMGLTLDEFKSFVNKFFKAGELIDGPELGEALTNFKETFGLTNVEYFEVYMKQILKRHLGEYDVSDLSPEEFKHIGGPIILSV